jgi:hypothetical protein
MLYDILANGGDPNLASGTIEAVQTFLHQHARTKHSLPEFVAFFAQHKLSMVRDTGFGLALPPLPLRGAPRVSEQRVERAPEPKPMLALPEPESIEVAPVVLPIPARFGRPAIWASAAVVLAAISGGTFWAVSSAYQELEHVRAEQRATTEILSRVQSETASLRERLERSNELTRSVDHKTELLLQSLVSPLDPKTR